jgi:Uma2 family endonuclease
MENEVKEPAPKYNYVSPEEYLERERASEEKHEYYKGEVYAMAGATLPHNDIFYNVYSALCIHLKGKNCKPYGSDLRIHIPSNTLYTYPDISIVCDKPVTTDLFADNLINPSVLIEILSKSSEDYDRGTKFHLYRGITTLKEYITIDSRTVCVELYTRQDNNSWVIAEFKQRTDKFVISTIGLRLSLWDVYEDVGIAED